jgi:hypothetical protein
MRCLQATMSIQRHPTLVRPCARDDFALNLALTWTWQNPYGFSRSNLKTSSKRHLFLLCHRLLGGDLNYPKNERIKRASSEADNKAGGPCTAAKKFWGASPRRSQSGYKSKIKLTNLAGRDVRAVKAPRRSSRCDTSSSVRDATSTSHSEA